MAVKIRPITLNDAASYRQCWDAVAKERRHLIEHDAPPLSEVRSRLRKSVRRKTPFSVAADGERVVGWAAVFRPGQPSLDHCGILMMGLLPDYRRIGLGTKLATSVLKKSRGKIDSVIFCFFRKNKAARKLSKKMGFELCAQEKNFVKLAYGFDDQLTMQRRVPQR